ncbi:MAG: DUF2029 domain-containing protein [Ignavibacteriae bacterium]|nr:DUF2029 domain-containing protein [Ignavibacteriota bacterium]
MPTYRYNIVKMVGDNTQTANFAERNSRIVLMLGVLVHLLLLFSLVFGFLNPLFDDATHRRGPAADFYAVYQAGQNIVDGVSVYERNPPSKVVPYSYPYRYLPFTALTLGQFFRLVSPPVAYALWILILESLLLINLKLTSRLFSNVEHQNIAVALWLMFSPYYLELFMGQFSFRMSTLFFWMMYYWSIGRHVSGDVLWTTSLLIKSNSILFVPVLMKLRKWKSLIVAGGVMIAFSLPYFLLYPDTIKPFARNFTAGLSAETIAGNQGFAALLGVCILRFGGHWVSYINEFAQNIGIMNEMIRIVLLIWTIVILSYSLLLTVRTSATYINELFLLWILTYFLTYKHVWEHQYVMLLPVFVLLFLRMCMQDGFSVPFKKVFWWTFAIIALPTPFIFIDKTQVLVDPEFYWTTAESLAFHLGKPLAVLILYSTLCVSLWKYGKRRFEMEESVKTVQVVAG